MNRVTQAIGRRLAGYLQRPVRRYRPFAVTPLPLLRGCLRPADVLLVEGDSRISATIKYLTTSTWSHAAFFVGDADGRDLIEADLRRGVRYAGLGEYAHLNTRVCRAVHLAQGDLVRVMDFMRASVGMLYDLRNFLDLARYLLPVPPIPHHLRRRALTLGSGDPTRAICSTLIAEAFQSVRYPILPELAINPDDPAHREFLHIRDHSLFVPRDFDLSPYFEVVKPAIAADFDYRALHWDSAAPDTGGVSPPSRPA